MPEGMTYVIAAYGLSAAVLALWFAMILRRLRATAPGRGLQRGGQ